VTVWRQLEGCAAALGELVTRRAPAFARLRPLVTAGVRGGGAMALILWWWNFLPGGAGPWLTLAALSLVALAGAVFWRHLLGWHGSLESALQESLGAGAVDPARQGAWLDRHAPWGLQTGEVTLPDSFALAGRSIGEGAIRRRSGCSIVGIERQSYVVANPGPTAHLFPGDRVLLLGTEAQIEAARELLLAESPAGRAGAGDADLFRDLAVEMVQVPPDSPAAGQSLAALNWPRLLGVQVVGHERDGQRTLSPAADLRLEAGDRLLVLGTPHQVADLSRALCPTCVDGEGPDGQSHGGEGLRVGGPGAGGLGGSRGPTPPPVVVA